jgi:transposase
LVGAVRRHIMAAAKLRTEDTPVPVLVQGNGKTKTGNPIKFTSAFEEF